jgi:hypothetical protein
MVEIIKKYNWRGQYQGLEVTGTAEELSDFAYRRSQIEDMMDKKGVDSVNSDCGTHGAFMKLAYGHDPAGETL